MEMRFKNIEGINDTNIKFDGITILSGYESVGKDTIFQGLCNFHNIQDYKDWYNKIDNDFIFDKVLYQINGVVEYICKNKKIEIDFLSKFIKGDITKISEYHTFNVKFIQKTNEILKVLKKNIYKTISETTLFELLMILEGIRDGKKYKRNIFIFNNIDAYLHPKYQLMLGEMIILLKKINIDTLVITNSPYLIRAIEVFSAKYNLSHKCNYYLSDKDEENKSSILDATDNVDIIYKQLSEPFEKLMQIEYVIEEGE